VLKETNKDFLSLLGYIYLQNEKADKAMVVFETLQEMEPNNPRVRYSLSYAYYLGVRYEEALECIEAFLVNAEYVRKYPSAYILKGKILWKLKRPEEARAMMNTYIEIRRERHDTSLENITQPDS